MELCDIDWRTGTLVVHGKGSATTHSHFPRMSAERSPPICKGDGQEARGEVFLRTLHQWVRSE